MQYTYYEKRIKRFMTSIEFDYFFRTHPGIYESIEIVSENEKKQILNELLKEKSGIQEK